MFRWPLNKPIFLLLMLAIKPIVLLAQITVLEGNSEKPVQEVAVFNAKGEDLCVTDSMGKVPLQISTFPVFFEKDGYVTQGLYGLREGKAVVHLLRMGDTLGTVEITGKLNVKDYLLHLVKDVNKPDFFLVIL